MTPEAMNVPHTVQAASSIQKGVAKIVVTTGDGRVFNLGRPTSIFFPLRRAWYLFRRRNEFKEVSLG